MSAVLLHPTARPEPVKQGFRYTDDQQTALHLLGGQARHTMLYGGSRSGKTFLLATALILRAIRAPESRHAIFRHRFNHLKISVGMDTIPKVMRLRFPGVKYHIDRTDWVMRVGDRSEIWLGGLDDKERTEKILGQEYCVDPESKVLTADLRWVAARTLRVGEEIVGFPENLAGNQRLVRASVERTEIIQAEKYRIVTDRGETIVSAQHKFVGGKPQTRNRLRWVEAQHLQPGAWIKFATAPWSEPKTYAAGWLAGIYDGEGCIAKTGSYAHCQVAQKPGVVLEAIKAGLAEIGVKFNESRSLRGGVTNLHCAGLWQGMRLIGMVRPRRLLPKAAMLWEGRRAFNTHGDHHYAKVVRVEHLGRGPVVSLGTSSKTLIADGFLGHNCTLYFNECSQIAYSAVLMARTRLAQKTALVNRAYYDCNPPGSKHWTAMVFVSKKDPASKPTGLPLPNPDNFAAMVMNPHGNRENLSAEYIAELEAMPDRQRQRFLLGKFTAELDNALWTLESFRPRLTSDPVGLAEQCERVVVAVDPSGASGAEDKRSDEIGISVCGKFRGENRYVVLEDATLRGSPQQWARAAINCYRKYKADRIICERNFGGAMVQFTIKTEDPNVPLREVVASRGKTVRSEPIATLYAQGIVEHVEGLSELEDQMLNMTAAGYMGEKSPDRLDAAVWGLTDLSQGKQIKVLGVF